jgi:hypothetical protein
MGAKVESNSIFYVSFSFLIRILLYKQNHVKICTHEKEKKMKKESSHFEDKEIKVVICFTFS